MVVVAVRTVVVVAAEAETIDHPVTTTVSVVVAEVDVVVATDHRLPSQLLMLTVLKSSQTTRISQHVVVEAAVVQVQDTKAQKIKNIKAWIVRMVLAVANVVTERLATERATGARKTMMPKQPAMKSVKRDVKSVKHSASSRRRRKRSQLSRRKKLVSLLTTTWPPSKLSHQVLPSQRPCAKTRRWTPRTSKTSITSTKRKPPPSFTKRLTLVQPLP